MRFLEKLPKNTKIGGVVFVAGWFSLKNLETVNEWQIAKPWFKTPVDFAKIRLHMKNSFAIFSDNDPFVPLSEKEVFKQELGSKIIIEKNKGHLTEEDGIKKLPSALESVLGFV